MDEFEDSLHEQNKQLDAAVYHCEVANGFNKDTVLKNFETRITILQMEKDSVYQLWQMALRAIDVLEEELKSVHQADKNATFYQHQINNLKETYSEAINILETKLVAGKERFFEQQLQWDKSKQSIDQLVREKNDIIQQLNDVQRNALEREKVDETKINLVKKDLEQQQAALEKMKISKEELVRKCEEAEKVANNAYLIEKEAKQKVSEALDIVKSVVREKEDSIKRETILVEENKRLEMDFYHLSEEYNVHLEQQILKAKEMYDRNIKKYLLEIKELKSELRDKVTLLDGLQRENSLIAEELEKIKNLSNEKSEKPRAKHLDQESAYALSNNETCQIANSSRIIYLESQISQLQDKVQNATEKLRHSRLQSSREIEDYVRETGDRTRDIIEKCSNFEKQLSRALIDKENLSSNLYTLEKSFEKEIFKRNQEKLLLEEKIRDLQEKISNEDYVASKRLTDIADFKCSGVQTSICHESISSIFTLQKEFEKKTKELTYHVETHQKLSKRWKEEAQSLTSKFQKRSQELKIKVNMLRKQNEELSNELIFFQKLVTQSNIQLIQNHSFKDNELY